MTENRCIEVLKKMKHIFTETCAKIDENTALDMAIEAVKEIQQYRVIGTVEEFKALKDKRVTKKVKGISLTHESRVGNCPNCNQFVVEKYDKRCPKCRFELDWEGKENV